MRRSRFSVEQIFAMLKQSGLVMPAEDVIRNIGSSQQTFYRRKKHYASLDPDQARELKQLLE